MTKAELIDSLANKSELPKQKAEEIVNGLFDDIVGALKNGDKVNISGFGTFSVSERKARTGRNPKTGEAIQIAASRAPKFKAGKILKESLAQHA
jgi:integration host factor beta subunit